MDQQLPGVETGMIMYGILPAVFILLGGVCAARRHPMALFFAALLAVWYALPIMHYGVAAASTLFLSYSLILLVPLVILRLVWAGISAPFEK